MAIPLSDYDKIHSRPGRRRTGDDGLSLSKTDEAVLDKAWATVAAEDGVEQLPDQGSEAEIRDYEPPAE